MSEDDGSLRSLLLQLSPSARDKLRTVLIRDDRDEIAQLLLRYGGANGDGWADVIDLLEPTQTSGSITPPWAASRSRIPA